MPTRHISLTSEQDAFVSKDQLRLKALRAQLVAGVAALDRGDFTDVDQADLGAFLNGLTNAQPRRR
jgi:antitoxin ParD1/3/4